jgi:pyridoxal phosphate enzyme (YggS family)
MEGVATQLASIQNRIDESAKAASRPPVALVAVTKTFGATDILPALNAGHRMFGENRVQEAQGKWPTLREQFADIDLHLIGRLQSNKASEAVALFDTIHTIDRDRIAEAVAQEMAKQKRRVRLLVQVNIGMEPQKAGVAPGEAAAFVARCRMQFGLAISGLMCVPPHDMPPAPYFALTAKLAADAGVAELSMGMSGDFETAIAFGATMVRVGSAIFGNRIVPA